MQFCKQTLVDAPDREYDTFPTCFGDVTIQSLTETERCSLDAKNLDKNGVYDRKLALHSRINMVIASVVDPKTKQRVFSKEDAADLKKRSKFISQIYLRALQLNGPDGDDTGGGDDSDDTVKNSRATDDSCSPAE